MRKINLIAIGIIFGAFATFTAFGQEQVPAKVALINTNAFYEKDGIKKITDAYLALDAEFKVDFAALETMAKRFEALQAEAQKLQNSPTPVKAETRQATVDEAEKLEREFKFKQEDSKARYSRREAVVLEPIVNDIGNKIGEFAKQKGYTLVFDSGKLAQVQMLLFLQDSTEITKEFVIFYNSRPAGTATK